MVIKFEGVTGWVHERKKVSANISKMIPTSIPKSMKKTMQNLCSKNGANIMEKGTKTDPKWGPI